MTWCTCGHFGACKSRRRGHEEGEIAYAPVEKPPDYDHAVSGNETFRTAVYFIEEQHR
jgi:hypothetical protein